MSAPTLIITHAGIRGMRIDWTPYEAGIGVLTPLVFAVADDPRHHTAGRGLSRVSAAAPAPDAYY
jgi:hypothetical protein